MFDLTDDLVSLCAELMQFSTSIRPQQSTRLMLVKERDMDFMCHVMRLMKVMMRST